MALPARLGIGRDFILAVTGFGQQRLTLQLHVPGEIMVRQGRWVQVEMGIWFQGQLIVGDMGRRQIDRLLQVCCGLLQ